MRVLPFMLALFGATAAVTLPRSASRLDKALSLRGGGSVTAAATVKAPGETYHGMAEKGAANAKLPMIKTLHQSVLGGCYVGFGGLLSTVVAGNCAGIASSNPGLQKLIFAILFPVNLLLILMTGGQLFTGNSAAVPAALYEGLVTFDDLVRSWVTSYIGNIIGCVGFACAANYAGLLAGGAKDLAAATATKKCASAFGPTLVKAIMCNWLVCMAVFLAGAANDLTGKAVGIYLPISAFVAIGLEHSVANLFLLPLGLLGGADLSIGEVITKNLIPVTLGNAIAGAVIVAGSYSYAFGALGASM